MTGRGAGRAGSPWGAPPLPPEVRRAVALFHVGDQIFAIDIDGDDATIEAVVETRDDTDEDAHLLDLTRVSTRRWMNVSIEAWPRPHADRLWTYRLLTAWPDLSAAADTRCAARLTLALGPTVRCERWAGHAGEADARAHVAGVARWFDGDTRSLDPTPTTT